MSQRFITIKRSWKCKWCCVSLITFNSENNIFNDINSMEGTKVSSKEAKLRNIVQKFLNNHVVEFNLSKMMQGE
jgi:hypothetical protein